MQKIILLFTFFIYFQFASGQNNIQFKVSKPYCIFNFLETAIHSRGTSGTYRNYIAENTKDDTVFRRICTDFKNIRLDYTYKREEFPESRRQFRSTYDLIDIALANSSSLEEFRDRSIGILPDCDQQALLAVLKLAGNYYDKLIWTGNEQKLDEQKKALDEYSPQASAIFNTLKHFYNASWTNDIPFIVSLYPIPGRKGNTTDTPHANSLLQKLRQLIRSAYNEGFPCPNC